MWTGVREKRQTIQGTAFQARAQGREGASRQGRGERGEGTRPVGPENAGARPGSLLVEVNPKHREICLNNF